MAELTPTQWKAIQAKWEGDERPGYKWIVEELNLPISPQAVGKKARRGEWKKVAERKWEAGELERQVRSSRKKPEKPETSENPSGSGSGGDIPPEDGDTTTPDNAPGNLPATVGDSGSNAGRPTLYRSEYAVQAHKLALLGLTEAEIADVLLVCEKTIANWKKEHKEFLQAIRNGRHLADAEVANALYLRATGYSHSDVHISTYLGEVTLTEITKHYPPDPQCQRFWLMNRQPDLWKTKVETPPKISQDDMPDMDELEQIYQESLERARQKADEIINRGERLGVTVDMVGEVSD